MIAAPAAAESRTTAAGPMPILISDAAPLLLMVEGEADADELVCAVVAGAVVVGATVDAVDRPVPVLELVDVVDVDGSVALDCAETAKSPLCA